MSVSLCVNWISAAHSSLTSIEKESALERSAALTDVYRRVLVLQDMYATRDLQSLLPIKELTELEERVEACVRKALTRGFDHGLTEVFHLACLSGKHHKIDPFLQSLQPGDASVLFEGLKRVLHQQHVHLIPAMLTSHVTLEEDKWLNIVMQELIVGHKSAFEMLISFPPNREKIDSAGLCLTLIEYIKCDDIAVRALWETVDHCLSKKMDEMAFHLAAALGGHKIVRWYLRHSSFSGQQIATFLATAISFGQATVVGAFLQQRQLFPYSTLAAMLAQAERVNSQSIAQEILVAYPHMLIGFQEKTGSNICLLLEVIKRQPLILFYADPEAQNYSDLEEAFARTFREDPDFVLSLKVLDEHGIAAKALPFDPWQALRLVSGLQTEEGGEDLDGVSEESAFTVGVEIMRILQEGGIQSCHSDILAKAFATATQISPLKSRAYYQDYVANLPVIILTGCRHHYMTVLLYKEHMVMCDRNSFKDSGSSVMVHKIDPSLMSEAVIDKIMLCVNAAEENVVDLFLCKLLPEYLSRSFGGMSSEDTELKGEIENAFRSVKVLKAANCNIAAWKKGLHLAQFLLLLEEKKALSASLRVKQAAQTSKLVANQVSYVLRINAFHHFMPLSQVFNSDDSFQGKRDTALAAFFKAMKKRCSFISTPNEILDIELASQKYEPFLVKDSPAYQAYLHMQQALAKAKEKL